MNKKKNNNSVLLLTTLGVYIGLLMVGSTPGIVAQQGAMTRNFEISEEAEVKDDLDLDPKDEQAGSDEHELNSLISRSSVRSIVQVYLSQFAVNDSGTSSPSISGRNEIRSVLCRRSSNLISFWPNDVRESSASNIPSLPRAGLNALLARDAK